MNKEKETRVSQLMSHSANKVLYIALLVVAIIGICLVIISGETVVSMIPAEKVVLSFFTLTVPMVIGLSIAYQINKIREDVVRKYEEQLFREEARRKWLLDQCTKVRELIIFSDEKLEVLVETRLRNNAMLDLDEMKMELSMPRKKYTGQELREALLKEKERLEAEIDGIVIPEKPIKYLWWEKHFKLNEVQVA